MPRPKKNDDALLKRNIHAIRASTKWRAEAEREPLWRRMIDLYSGKHYATKSAEDRMLVNLAKATKDVIAPSVAVNNPRFTVNARRPDAAAQAIITEQVLNYLWRVGRYQEDFRLAVDDFLIVGHGWVKVGYKATKPKQQKELPDVVDDTGDGVGVDDRDETVVGNVESELNTFMNDADRPFVERISPFDIFVDPDATHPRYMNWIAQRTRRLLVDAVADSRYDPKMRNKLSAYTHGERVDDESAEIVGTPDGDRRFEAKYVDIWEFYDIRKGTVATFCDKLEEGFLIPPAPMPYAFGHPFLMLRNYEVPDRFYPMGELESIEELQHELNATRTQMMNHRKRYQRKVLYNRDAFDADGVAALQDDKDNVLVPVDVETTQTNLNEVIAPMPQMGTPPDFYNQSELIANDIDRVSGVSDYMRGAQADIRRTATEAAMIQDAMNARAADKLSRVESALGRIGERLVMLMQQYLTGEHVVRVVGMNAQPLWINYDADYIQGEFDFEIEGGSTQPRNDSFRRQASLQLVDALAPFIGAGVVNPVALARHVLQYGFDVKDPDSFLGNPMMGGPEGAGPEGAGGPGGPPPMQGGMPVPDGVDATTQEDAVAESPIEGIPPQLIAQLVGQQGLPVG